MLPLHRIGMARAYVLVVCRHRCHAGRMHDQGRRRRQRRRWVMLRRRGRQGRRRGGVAVAALGHLERHPDPLQLRHAQPSPRLPPRRRRRRDVLGHGGLPLLPAGGLSAHHGRRVRVLSHLASGGAGAGAHPSSSSTHARTHLAI